MRYPGHLLPEVVAVLSVQQVQAQAGGDAAAPLHRRTGARAGLGGDSDERRTLLCVKMCLVCSWQVMRWILLLSGARPRLPQSPPPLWTRRPSKRPSQPPSPSPTSSSRGAGWAQQAQLAQQPMVAQQQQAQRRQAWDQETPGRRLATSAPVARQLSRPRSSGRQPREAGRGPWGPSRPS